MKSLISKKGKLFLFFVLFVALALSGFYVFEKLSGGDIALDVKAPNEKVEVGVPFDINVRFANDSQNALGSVRIVLEFSENLISADGSSGVITRELGDISSGSVHQESFQVIATPAEKPDYKVKATVFYSPVTLVAEFKKVAEVDVNVEAPSFDLTLQAPEKIFPGEEFETKITYKKRKETSESPELVLNLNVPDGLQRVMADPAIDTAENTWLLDTPKEGEEGSVLFRGKTDSVGNISIDISAELAMKILGKEYTFLVAPHTIVVEPSPISFQIALSEGGDVVRPGEKLTYIASYRNNTEVDLQDIVIRAQLIGDMFDIDSLETSAGFNRLTNTITWNAGDFEELRRIKAGGGGKLAFSVKVKDGYPIKRLSDKNFVLKVNANIESPTVPYLIDADKTVNKSSIETKVAGRVEVTTRALFRDAGSGIVNSGPFPPRVGVPTNYTIHWSVKNFGTDVGNVEVRASLENGVRFTGTTKNNSGSEPYFDPETGEVVWQIGRLVATAGLLGETPSATFQIEAIPSALHKGKYMPLIGVTEIRGDDEFTGQAIGSTAGLIDTRLSGDPTVKEGDGLVK